MTGGPLRGRTALVTGAGSGIGAAIVRRLVADGATVRAVDLDGGSVAALAADLPGVEPVTCDLTDLDAADALVAGAGVDVLVNNAGRQHVAPVHHQRGPKAADPARFAHIRSHRVHATSRVRHHGGGLRPADRGRPGAAGRPV